MRNVPAATGFGSILVIVGTTYTDMNATGQSAIVAANNAGTTGVVFTEWASYNGSTVWATLGQLVLLSYSSYVTGYLGYTLTSAGHPIWTGLPNTITTANSTYYVTGTIKNGGVSIASVGSGGSGVLVKNATGRVVEINNTAHGGANTGAPWNNDANFSKLTANALKWSARCL